MSTSSALVQGGAARPLPFWDTKFAKRFAIACCLVPGLLLALDAARGRLGVNGVNYAIRSTGLLGITFLSLSLLITPVKRLTGAATLIGVRRNLGVFGFFYIALHFAIFFGWDRAASISSTLEEIVSRVYLWFGTGALVIMIPLAATSTDGMVTRLGPVWWKRLHRLAYVAVACGLVHYYLLVKADTTKPFAFSVAFGGMMLFRAVGHYVDLRKEIATGKTKLAAAKKAGASGAKKKFWQGELVIARVFEETHDVKTFRMVPVGGGPLPFDYIAGQYLNLALTIGGKRVNRSYTIASSPTRGAYVEISVKKSKYGSVHLHETWKEGDRVKVSAPAGKFHFAGGDGDAKRIVLVAGGVGITPCMSVIRSLTDRGWKGDMYLAYAVRTRKDVIFDAEIKYLQARFPNLHVAITLSQEQAEGYAHGHLDRAKFEKLVPDFVAGVPVMMCGPEPMMAAMRKLLVEDMKLPNDQVHEEAFVSPPSTDDGAVDVAATEAAEAAVDGAIEFARSGKRTDAVSLTVLEAAEEEGVKIPYECRSGVCGQCKTKLLSGRVVMESQDALTRADREKGLILACQARPVRDVSVDA